MHPQTNQETYGIHTGDLRPYVSNPLGQCHRHTGTGDIRETYAAEPLAARVVGVRLGAHTPHRTHAAMSTTTK